MKSAKELAHTFPKGLTWFMYPKLYTCRDRGSPAKQRQEDVSGHAAPETAGSPPARSFLFPSTDRDYFCTQGDLAAGK